MEIEPIYDKRLECMHCKNKFTTKKVRSRSVRVVSHESDFKPIYTNKDVNPVYYNAAVCPHCGFAFTEDFSPYFAPGTKEAIDQQVTAQWIERSYGGERTFEEAVEAYKLAYLSGMLKKEKALTLAGLTLRIAWLYREAENEIEEKRFMSIAKQLYLDAYSAGDYVGTQMSETRVMYLIAELAWKTGDRDEAVRSFSRVIENQKRSNEPHIVEMAKDRWQEIRQQE